MAYNKNGLNSLEELIKLDLKDKYKDKSEDYFKIGEIVKSKSYNNGGIFYFTIDMGGISIVLGPYIEKENKYYIIDKDIIDKNFLPIDNKSKALKYFKMLESINELPKMKDKLSGYIEINKKSDYDKYFVADFKKCLEFFPISNIKIKDKKYLIEKIYFNYEDNAFLKSVNYELSSTGKLNIKNEKIIKECGKGVKEGIDYIY